MFHIGEDCHADNMSEHGTMVLTSCANSVAAKANNQGIQGHSHTVAVYLCFNHQIQHSEHDDKPLYIFVGSRSNIRYLSIIDNNG